MRVRRLHFAFPLVRFARDHFQIQQALYEKASVAAGGTCPSPRLLFVLIFFLVLKLTNVCVNTMD
jgi:hypothetical protein